MIVAVPVALGVNVTEHEPLTVVQLAALNDPAAPVDVNATVPVRVLVVPGEVSATVAVHVLDDPTPTDAGKHETVVEVALRLTVIDPVPELVAWVASPL